MLQWYIVRVILSFLVPLELELLSSFLVHTLRADLSFPWTGLGSCVWTSCLCCSSTCCLDSLHCGVSCWTFDCTICGYLHPFGCWLRCWSVVLSTYIPFLLCNSLFPTSFEVLSHIVLLSLQYWYAYWCAALFNLVHSVKQLFFCGLSLWSFMVSHMWPLMMDLLFSGVL